MAATGGVGAGGDGGRATSGAGSLRPEVDAVLAPRSPATATATATNTAPTTNHAATRVRG